MIASGRIRKVGCRPFCRSANHFNGEHSFVQTETRKKVCFCLQVKPSRIAEYKARHAAVWPEMLSALSAAGWHNYSLFLRDDGLLIGYVETPDFGCALRLMAATEINRKWQTEMAEFFDGTPGDMADQQMQPIEQVFHLP